MKSTILIIAVIFCLSSCKKETTTCYKFTYQTSTTGWNPDKPYFVTTYDCFYSKNPDKEAEAKLHGLERNTRFTNGSYEKL